MAWRGGRLLLRNVQLETFTIIQILEEKVGMKTVDIADSCPFEVSPLVHKNTVAHQGP